MRNLKRALSLALASVMLMGMMVVGSSAASFPDVSSEDNTEAIAVLEAVEVMIGNENGEFEPDKNVTRNEMAVILAKLILGKDADKYVGTCPFTDVPEWAQKYVAACYDNKIVAGRTESLYDGNATVTAQEAAAMVLRVLGYEKLESQGTNWAQPVVAKANEIRLFKDVGSSATMPLNRNQVAQLSLNALQATMVNTKKGSTVTVGGVDITADVEYVDREVEVTSPSDAACAISGPATISSPVKVTLQLGEYLYDGDLKRVTGAGTEDDFGFQGAKWEYGTGSNKEIGTFANATVVATYTKAKDVTYGDLYKLGDWQSGAITIVENGNDRTTATTDIQYNKDDNASDALTWKGSSKKVGTFANYNGAQVNIVDQNGDGTIDAVIVVYGYLGKVTKVNEATKSKDRNVEITVYDDAAGQKITYETEDFEKDDYVVAYPDTVLADGNLTSSSELIKVEAAESVTGAVTAYAGNATNDYTSLTVDGTKYDVGKTAKTLDTVNLKKGEYVVYLLNGQILGVVADGKYSADIGDVVYVLGVEVKGVESGKEVYYVRVIHMNGDYELIKVPSDKHDANANSLAAGFYHLDTDTDGDYKFVAPTDGTMLVTKAGELATADEVYAKDALKGATNFKPETKSVAIKNGGTEKKAYLTADTRYIFVEDSKDRATVITGGITKSSVADGTLILVSNTKDDGTGDYEVEAVILSGSYSGSVGDDVLYLKADRTGQNTIDRDTIGYTYDAYGLDGEKIKDFMIEDSTKAAGFYNYGESENGLYNLSAVDTQVSGDADGAYAITGVKVEYSDRRDYINVSGVFSDMDVSGAEIVDLDSSAELDTFEKIGAADTITGVALVKDKKVIMFVVTGSAAAGSTLTITTANETIEASVGANGAYTVEVPTGAVAIGSSFNVTVKCGSVDGANNKFGETVSVTYNGETKKVVFKAADSTGQTVSFTAAAGQTAVTAGVAATEGVTLVNSNGTIAAAGGTNGKYTVTLSETDIVVGEEFTVTVACESVDGANSDGEEVTVTYNSESQKHVFTGAGTHEFTFEAVKNQTNVGTTVGKYTPA